MVEEFIQTVCDVLDIDVPKISYDTSNFSTKSTLGQCDPSGKTIYLAHPQKSLWISILSLLMNYATFGK